MYLSRIARTVTLIHRRDEYRAARILADKVVSVPNIVRITGVVTEIAGGDRLEQIEVARIPSGVERINADALFVAVGGVPNTDLVKGQLLLDTNGYIVTNEFMETSAPGVFAAGDVRNTPLRQIVTACADGAVAASRLGS